MRSVLRVIFALLAIATFSFCIYALKWIWLVKKPAIDQATYAFDEATHWLSLADKGMQDVRGNLMVSQTMVTKTAPAAPSESGKQPGYLDSMVARAVIRQVTPQMNDMQRTVDKVTEVSIVVNSILDSLHEVPAGSRDKLDMQQVAELQTQLNGVTQASRRLNDLLDSPGDGDSAAAQTARVTDGIRSVVDLTGEYQLRLQALEARVQQIRSTTLYWMNLAPMLATIFLGWVMISQVIVLIVAVRRRTRT